MKVKIKYGPDDEPHEVELNELTFFTHKGAYDVQIVESPQRVVIIQSPQTIEEGKTLDPHWAFWVFWEIIRDPGGVNQLPDALDAIRTSGTGFLHLAGLVNLACKTVFDHPDELPQFRYPESHLHPGVQCALADFFIALRHPWPSVLHHIIRGREPLVRLPKEYLPDKE
jgi:hypothetical protein